MRRLLLAGAVIVLIVGMAIIAGPARPAAATPAPTILTWYLRDALTGGPPQQTFAYGTSDCTPVRGDWDGDGDDTIGGYCGGRWYLRNSPGPGPPELAFAYGIAGYIPVVGDWDGDGVDGIGAIDGATWHLRQTATPGPPQVRVVYGHPGKYTYVVGDWDGNGTDTLGAVENERWYLRNALTTGPPDHVFGYGASTYTPVVGDWDGNGTDTVGMVDGATWHLRQSIGSGPPNRSIVWGIASLLWVPGDWNGDGVDGLGAVAAPFASSIEPVSAATLWGSWRGGCPVGPDQLRLVTVSHFGFDRAVHVGQIVVHRDHAARIVEVFRRLYDVRFAIERMVPIEAFGGNDDAAMAANDTSGFNCRPVTGGTSWSQHAYGWAVDINPVRNPYTRGSLVLPPAGRAWVAEFPFFGKIVRGDAVVRAFAEVAGWSWGGNWSSPDYMHFSATGR